MATGLTFSNTKRMILLAFTLTATSASYGSAIQRGPYDEGFCNPREAGSVLTNTRVMHVNDLVRVRNDKEAPTEILSFTEVPTHVFAPPSRSDSGSGLGSMFTSAFGRVRSRGFEAAPEDNYWVGIVRVAKHSLTESYYEIHHLDGWMPTPTSKEVGAEMSGMLVTPEGGLYDPKLVGGELRKELQDIAGWMHNQQLYDVRSTTGAYWFEEAQNNGGAANDDHYVKQINIRSASESLCEDDADAFMSDLVDQAKVTALLRDGERMHSYAMDSIDLTNDNIRAFWKAAGECIASRTAGNSDRGDVSTIGGLYGDVKRNWCTYREAGMNTVIGFTENITQNITQLRIELDAYKMLKDGPTCTYLSFDRDAYATVHRPQRPSKLAQIISTTKLDTELDAHKKSASKQNMLAMVAKAKERQAAKPKLLSKEDRDAKFAETLMNAQLDTSMVLQSTKDQAAYQAAVEEFDRQRVSGGVLVTGKNKDWRVEVQDLPADGSDFWGDYKDEKKTAPLALKRLKEVLKQVDHVDMMLLKPFSVKKIRETDFTTPQLLPYRGAAKAVLDDIQRPSNGKLIQEARSHVREILHPHRDARFDGESVQHTPVLCTTSNGRNVDILGWEAIHAYATKPLSVSFGRDGARDGATVRVIRR